MRGDGDRPSQLLTLVPSSNTAVHMVLVPATIGCFHCLRRRLTSQQITISEQCGCPSTLGEIFILLSFSAGQDGIFSAGSEPRRRGPTEALSGSPGSPDFPTHPRVNSGPKFSESSRSRSKMSAAGEAAKALQFPRLDRVFRNISLGGPTALFISVIKIRPSGQAAKLSLDCTWIPRWLLGFSPLESRKAYGLQD